MLKVLAGLVGIVLSLGAIAYGRVGSVDPGRPAARVLRTGSPAAKGPPAPRIFGHPEPITTATAARFRFSGPPGEVGFECRLDRAGWTPCSSPAPYRALARSPHAFLVRAVVPARRRSASARYFWTVVEAKAFSIVPRLSGLNALYPGSAPVALPLELANPNSVPILVTGLHVSVTADPAGCDSASNLALTQSSVSGEAPLGIPAGGSARVPSPGVEAPTIQLRNLAVNQDACRNARFPLSFDGTAR